MKNRRKENLQAQLADMTNSFTQAELQAIIHGEFFDDRNSLNVEIVNAALMRLIRLKGLDPDDAMLQNERELLVYNVLKQILQKKEK